MSSRHTFSRIYAFSSNDIKVGTNIEVDGAPWRVLEFLLVKLGKGAAFFRTKLKNYITGSTIEKTFRAGIKVKEAEVSKETKQFTYKDGAQFMFMDLTTYEEYCLNEKDLGDRIKWLKEGMDCILLFWNGKVYTKEMVGSDKFKTEKGKILKRKVVSIDTREILIGSIPMMAISDLCWMKTNEK